MPTKNWRLKAVCVLSFAFGALVFSDLDLWPRIFAVVTVCAPLGALLADIEAGKR